MSRSVADFDRGDVSLYFRNSYVLDTKKNKVVLLDATEANTAIVRGSNGRRYEANTSDLRQWWPPSRGVNWNDGPYLMGAYICRTAVRQSRRTASSGSLSSWSIRGGTPGFNAVDLSTAAAAHSPKFYCGLGLVTLSRWIEKYRQDYTVTSVMAGARLLYVPDNTARPFVGRLFYAPIGLIGRIDVEKGKLYRISDKGRRAKRAENTINRFMEG